MEGSRWANAPAEVAEPRELVAEVVIQLAELASLCAATRDSRAVGESDGCDIAAATAREMASEVCASRVDEARRAATSRRRRSLSASARVARSRAASSACCA